uniref:F-box protein 3 n=1 Tax=Xenopus tropicalis TaxID=8364 RepID=A0A6I8R7S3_XENTR
MALVGALSLLDLPSDPLLVILSYLDFRDLVSCSLVNRRLQQLSNHDLLWKRPCQIYWLVSESKIPHKTQTWKETFITYYKDLGRYIEHYAKLKKAWDSLKQYLAERCPKMISSLKAGVQEKDLNAVEEKIGCKLPDDYRCSLRIHNGQKLVVPGLMGSMALPNHYRSEDFLDIDTAAGGFQRRMGLNQCLPITFCIHTGISQYLALADTDGRRRNEIFYQCPDQIAHNPAAIDMFITATSFFQWFTSYVQHVVSGDYPIIWDQIFRLEMSKDAYPEKACQLDSRYWRITNAKEQVEEVQGPGVVGDYPQLRPGRVYEYTSCTTFSTSSGYMEGYYTFHRLDKKQETFNVVIPRFHMKCLTFRASTISTEESCNDCFFHDDDSTDTDDYEERRRFLDMPNAPVHCPRFS